MSCHLNVDTEREYVVFEQGRSQTFVFEWYKIVE